MRSVAPAPPTGDTFRVAPAAEYFATAIPGRNARRLVAAEYFGNAIPWTARDILHETGAETLAIPEGFELSILTMFRRPGRLETFFTKQAPKPSPFPRDSSCRS
jgi:hypothetical protein